MDIGKTPVTDEDALDYAVGAAAGVFARKYVDSALGDLSVDDAFGMATDISVNPGASSELLGVSPADMDYINPEVLREKLMDMYLSQSAADDLVVAIETDDNARSGQIAARHDAVMRNIKATPDQRQRMEFDSENGDDSALIKAKESFFFE